MLSALQSLSSKGYSGGGGVRVKIGQDLPLRPTLSGLGRPGKDL